MGRLCVVRWGYGGGFNVGLPRITGYQVRIKEIKIKKSRARMSF